MNCKTCGGEMIQKSRVRLLVVGVLMFATIPLAFFIPFFWMVDIVLVLTGAYLLMWATLGRGYWYRNCKKFSSV
jgi:hypothetical protein